MKIHLIHYKDSMETQPIDLENIFTIGIVSVRESINNNDYIWGHQFYIVPKIGHLVTIFSKVGGTTRKDNKIAQQDKEFIVNERNKLIDAWSKQ